MDMTFNTPATDVDLQHGHAYVLKGEANDAMVIHDHNGDLVLDCVRDGDRVPACRVARFSEGDPDEALAGLRAGDVDFPEFRGRYAMGEGLVECRAQPPLTTRAVRDMSLLDAVLGEMSCTLEETRRPAAAP